MSNKYSRINKEFMPVLRPHLHFLGIQIKSEEAFHRFAKAVAEIEEVVGIHPVTISIEDPFICPWCNFKPTTRMEHLIKGLIDKLPYP